MTQTPAATPHLDLIERAALADRDPMYEATAAALGRWLLRRADAPGHYVGTFLEQLAERGYRVVPTEPTPPAPPAAAAPVRASRPVAQRTRRPRQATTDPT